MRSSDLVSIAVASGLASNSTCERTYRALRERGVIVQTGRGRFASSLDVLDLAKLLVAIVLPLPIEQSVAVTEQCLGLPYSQFVLNDKLPTFPTNEKEVAENIEAKNMVEQHFGVQEGPIRFLANIIELIVAGNLFNIEYPSGQKSMIDSSRAATFYIMGFEKFRDPGCMLDITFNKNNRMAVYYGEVRCSGNWERQYSAREALAFLTAGISYKALERVEEAYRKVGLHEPHLPRLRGWKWKTRPLVK